MTRVGSSRPCRLPAAPCQGRPIENPTRPVYMLIGLIGFIGFIGFIGLIGLTGLLGLIGFKVGKNI